MSSNASKRKIQVKIRRPNFSTEEIKVLVDEYKLHAKHLDGKFSTTITGPSKKVIWNKIALKVNSVGGCNRSNDELMKKYKNFKSEAKRIEAGNRRSFRRTGGGSPEYENLDENQMTVASTLSRAAIEGVNGGVDLYDEIDSQIIGAGASLQLVDGKDNMVISDSDEDLPDIREPNLDTSQKDQDDASYIFTNNSVEGKLLTGMATSAIKNKDTSVVDSQLPSTSSGNSKKIIKGKDQERRQITSLFLKSTPSSTKAREDRISTPNLLRQQVKLLEKQVDVFEEIRDELRIGNELKREIIVIEKQKLELMNSN